MLRVIPLGGLGEVGMNALVLEAHGQRLLIDCGLMFPRADQLGVDVVLPDFASLAEGTGGLSGVVLTHAHEDHLGALPWLLKEFPGTPVYGTPFTLAVARHKLEEAGTTGDLALRPMGPRQAFAVGEAFQVEPVRVTHSVPDAVGLVVRAAGSTLVHTGDFKLDDEPLLGERTDLERLAEVGEEGVDVLLSDSTNAERPGTAGSEAEVKGTFERLFPAAPGRVVVALFGSHLARVKHVVELAASLGRKVAILGRSLQRNLELARAVGVLKLDEELLVPLEVAAALPPERLVVVCTGAQGEPRAALSSMVNREDGWVPLEKGDLVIFSARTIPGNEGPVGDLMNRLHSRQVKVVHAALETVHVSGHAARDEQTRMIHLVRPRAFIPVHGELKHLEAHLQVASAAGLSTPSLLLLRDGDIAAVSQGSARLVGQVQAGRRLMRREGLTAISPDTLAQRRWLAESGVLAVVVLLEQGGARVLHGPVVEGRGLSGDEKAALPLAAEGARLALDELTPQLRGDDERVREALVRGVRRVLRQLLGARPAVMPIVLRR